MGDRSMIRQPHGQKSNVELVSSLRTNIQASQAAASAQLHGSYDRIHPNTTYKHWTSSSVPFPPDDPDERTLYIPALDPGSIGLQEPRSAYDITVKLFYLSGVEPHKRCQQTKEAIDLVLRELRVPTIDLLIISFPGIAHDAEDTLHPYSDDEDDEDMRNPLVPPPEGLGSQIQTWRTLETLHDQGLILKLGLAEFSAARLTKFVPKTRVKPGVDQINVRDCCIVPNALVKFAKREGIELLTHNDCSNILPRGTVRELLGPSAPASLSSSGASATTNANGDGSINGHSALSASLGGAGILAPDSRTGEKRKMHPDSDVEDTRANGEPEAEGLKGEVEPQWAIKYTAVVKNRGVVENKGYFAEAELTDA
ncbi:hypothetical protein LTR04_001609 [Oleoguttula sp. CCFEE 6159]|nr:hypothetical protein LTR04_001609 [Oleoguttula sp. CCFEE 6159]